MSPHKDIMLNLSKLDFLHCDGTECQKTVSVRLVQVVLTLPVTPNTTRPGSLPHASPSFAHPPKCVTPTSPVYLLNTQSGVHYLLVFHSG